MNSVPSTPPVVRAKANGIELAYDTFGDPAAPPLLLVMGLGTQMIAWEEGFCEQLAQRGYHVIRFDNRDIGLSTRFDQAGVPNVTALLTRAMAGQPLDVPYTLADMAADSIGLLDALGLDRAHVVGASMGGAIGQEIALRYPARVRSLTSIMATSGAPGLPPPTPEAMTALLTPTPLERGAYLARYRAVMQVLRGPVYTEDEAVDVARATRAFARGINPPGVARQLAAILASGSRKERLASLHVPTLVLHGNADPLVPIECGIDVAQTVPDAKLVVLEGMGHALPMPLWTRIVDAIDEHARRAP
ncbi:alpha/beta fold hydrolase [Burkholderia guangdongensis]|uniref:alpha/beta fold hydrolase n=1 Tax=Burkholderia guangdongensis TaxID=1792500 RepID=UPI0015CD8AFC|nr:alpha/beta hydrolase [Burkholderia guangdongensis]